MGKILKVIKVFWESLVKNVILRKTYVPKHVSGDFKICDTTHELPKNFKLNLRNFPPLFQICSRAPSPCHHKLHQFQPLLVLRIRSEKMPHKIDFSHSNPPPFSLLCHAIIERQNFSPFDFHNHIKCVPSLRESR